MKQLFTILTLIIFPTLVWAQDIIVKTNSERIEAKVVEVTDTYVKYKIGPSNSTLQMSIQNVSSIIYANGHIRMFDNVLCTLTAPPKKIDRNVYRLGNTYYYDGTPMKGDVYATFLKNNCYSAYNKYKYGQTISMIGWALMGVGLGLEAGFSWWWSPAIYLGVACEIACIPAFVIGYRHMHESVNIYNRMRGNDSQAYWSITTSSNGIGLAFNF